MRLGAALRGSGSRVRWLALLGAALLGACARTPPLVPVAHPQQVWQQREQRLARIHAWTAVGHAALRDRNQGWSFSLRWRQRDQAYHIDMHGPLGQGAVELAGSPGAVTMRTSKGEVWSAPDPATLMRERLGWSVPVSGLRYWILGRAEPGVAIADLALDVAGRPQHFVQSGWEVTYHGFTEVDGLALPTRVYLVNGPLSVRVAVTNWELPSVRAAGAARSRPAS